jgi:hypothetical protein
MRRARAWLTASHSWPQQWQDVSTFSDVALRLTVDEAQRLEADIQELLARYRRHDPERR